MLKPKEQAFADAWIRTGNASEAAREAGLGGRGPSGLGVAGMRMLAKPAVAAYLEARFAVAAQQADVDAIWIINRLKEEATVTESTTPASRVKSLDLLARRIAGFYAPTKTEVTGADGGPIETRYAGYDEKQIDALILEKLKVLQITTQD